MPGVGGDKEEDSGLTREELQEQEKLRWVWGNIQKNSRQNIDKFTNAQFQLFSVSKWLFTNSKFLLDTPALPFADSTSLPRVNYGCPILRRVIFLHIEKFSLFINAIWWDFPAERYKLAKLY